MSEERKFEDSQAVRSHVPLLVGLIGPSSSGKTFSALRLAEGMRQVSGGEIFVIDTEAKRSLHYSDRFKFRHVDFLSPFHPLDYLAAVRHCVRRGATNIIIDSESHMWEGPGGVLESHDSECQRLMSEWRQPRGKVQMAAWCKPKSDLRRFINEILQLKINIISCFRAKEKLKIVTGKDPEPLGWMPIAPEEIVYEHIVRCLLYPNSGGVPEWHPAEMGEKAIVKLPDQFRKLFEVRKPLDEDVGRKMAEWARGGKSPSNQSDKENLENDGRRAAAQGTESLRTWFVSLTGGAKESVKPLLDRELKMLATIRDLLDRVSWGWEKVSEFWPEVVKPGTMLELLPLENALELHERLVVETAA